jgi:ATP-binding protein involved in chromosome partitioning
MTSSFRQVIAVMSGKGGVGKSTVAVNLAVALARTGAKTALIDGDFYGPSVPTLMGGGELIADNEGRPIPPSKHGVKYMSIAFFMQNPDDPVIWRGPMLTKAMTQMFTEVSWGEVDYCVVDMPPGTGDTHLSLAQSGVVQIAGALVVTTPQEVALADVRKSINMLKKVNIDVLGIVENMAGFRAPTGEIFPIFGEGGGERIAQQFGVPLLLSVPLEPVIRAGGDEGVPVVSAPRNADGERCADLFDGLATKVVALLDEKRSSDIPLKVVN